MEITPELASKSAAVKVDTPLVEPSAAASAALMVRASPVILVVRIVPSPWMVKLSVLLSAVVEPVSAVIVSQRSCNSLVAEVSAAVIVKRLLVVLYAVVIPDPPVKSTVTPEVIDSVLVSSARIVQPT